MTKNCNAKKPTTTNKKLPRVLIGIVAILATAKLVLASLWGLQMACGDSSPPPPSIPEKTKPKTFFWQKEQPLPPPVTDSERKASVLCRTVWAVVDYVPFFTLAKHVPVEKPTECQQETKPSPFQKLSSIFKKGKRPTAAAELQTAFSKEISLSKSQDKLLKTLNAQFRERTDHFDERTAAVHWGGQAGSRWYTPSLLASYLRIMKWPEVCLVYIPLSRHVSSYDSY